jgi:hypothetical protein
MWLWNDLVHTLKGEWRSIGDPFKELQNNVGSKGVSSKALGTTSLFMNVLSGSYFGIIKLCLSYFCH